MARTKKNATEGLNGAIARVIRGELAIRGLRREDLAEQSGIPLQTLKNYLSSSETRARTMDLNVVAALAEALSMSPVILITRADALMHEEEQRQEQGPYGGSSSRSDRTA